MSFDKERLRYLLESYIVNNIREDEWTELKAYVQHAADNENLYAIIDELWAEVDMQAPMSIASEAIYQRILKDPDVLADPPRSIGGQAKAIQRLPWRLAGAVAAILCVAFSLFYIVRLSPIPDSNPDLVRIADPAQAILPGGNVATLTLADGRIIKLNEIDTGNLANEVGVRIIKSEEGLIFYQAARGASANREITYNTINTPKGGEYRVVLPDGTKVWLNAASSLRYPTSFTDDKREVELMGEAYFEVAKTKSRRTAGGSKSKVSMPFIVKTKAQAVEVLGTHFNINAYDDDGTVKTTLLEGRVKVSLTSDGQNDGPYRILKPNEQAVLTSTDGGIQVNSVDPANAIAWKNGYFAFDNENITEVMSTIARWYDIDVDYQGDVSGKVFGGTISRFESFEKLLETIGLTGTIQFKITGRRVTVMT
ncbi:iron dicitrate transporter FecR [Parapedobacter pyrenivorans]|uniref:Iron dicitrate transporter FecR n=1 Tax=Parapedobacter pyrenivorans TaxID=1305674 RepID=A0A917HHA8_9SPHI|nr:FecR family protein [Parapedobacter pyrenivorans]GGG79148.1 iron dicitrate transporter FecR [Parapedobacter pyrenivorans]